MANSKSKVQNANLRNPETTSGWLFLYFYKALQPSLLKNILSKVNERLLTHLLGKSGAYVKKNVLFVSIV
jgi:hypothetical protein